MSKPSQTVEWAFDATVATGPEAGQPTFLEPSSGFKGQGWVAEEESPARYMNWALRRLGEWSAYLDNLPAEEDFVDEDFVWGGDHTFEQSVTVADLTITGSLSVPAFEVELSALYVGNHIGLNGEIVYSDGVGSVDPRPRQFMLPLASGVCSGNIGGTAHAVLAALGSYWLWPSTSGELCFPFQVPRGSGLVSVRVGMSNQSGGTVSVSAVVLGRLANKTTPSATVPAGISTGGAATNILTLAEHIFVLDCSAVTSVDNSTADYLLAITGQVGARVHWIEVNYLDYGPRNS